MSNAKRHVCERHFSEHLVSFTRLNKLLHYFVSPVSPQQKVDICFFKCPNNKCNIFTFAQQHTDQNKHPPRQDDSSCYTSCYTVGQSTDKDKQTDWHVHTVSLQFSCTETHTPTNEYTNTGQQKYTTPPTHPCKQLELKF